MKSFSQFINEAKTDKDGNDKYDRYKRMVRHKQDKYGVSTLKQRLKHGGVDYNIDNEKKARNEDWQKKSGKKNKSRKKK